jgi:hypothetical protein
VQPVPEVKNVRHVKIVNTVVIVPKREGHAEFVNRQLKRYAKNCPPESPFFDG